MRSASFWCELLAALALALVFAGPRAACASLDSEHLVVVLDSSASMGALADGVSASDKTRKAVRARIDALPRGSRVTLLRSGSRPELVAGPAAFAGEAIARLEEWRPLAARHDLQPALSLALELAGGARVLVVSDHFEPQSWPEVVELISIGAPADNWALVHAVRTREAGAEGRTMEKVFLTVASFARVPRRLELEIRADGALLATREVEVGARERAHLSFEVPPGAGMLEVRLPEDALAIDNRVLLAPPVPRTLALHSELAEETARALGLSGPGEAALERLLRLVPQSVDAGGIEGAHVVLSNGAVQGPASWCLSFEPLGALRRDLIGPFLCERSHGLLAGTSFDGVVWSIDPELVLPGVPLVSAGNQPLLTEERTGERVLWRINLDPARSSLQRTPDWPILLANLAELRRDALPGPERASLHVGETLRHRPGLELAGVPREQVLLYVLEGPLEQAPPPRREIPVLQEVVVDGLEQPGLYRLSFQDREVARFALSFVDAAESDLSAALPGRREAGSANAGIEAELSWLEALLMGLTAALLLLDWHVLRRAARVLPGVA